MYTDYVNTDDKNYKGIQRFRLFIKASNNAGHAGLISSIKGYPSVLWLYIVLGLKLFFNTLPFYYFILRLIDLFFLQQVSQIGF